jgi:S-adenosylmethionine synthetase
MRLGALRHRVVDKVADKVADKVVDPFVLGAPASLVFLINP